MEISTQHRLLRAGIIGYGYMGEIRRRTCDRHEGLELVAVSDPRLTASPDPAARLAGNWEDVVDAADVDVVFVCTPNNMIPEVAVRALQRGKHVFAEKPPGRSLADIQRIAAAESANPAVKLIFGFNHRHHPGVVDAKAIVDSGSLGRVLTLRGLYGKSGGDGFEKSWRNDPAVGGAGILLDQGIHMLDLFRLFCGDFEEVIGMASTLHWEIPVEDNAFVLLRNSRGQMAQLHSSATQWKHTFRLEIGLEKGYLVISGLLSKTGSYGRETLVVGRRPSRGESVAVGNPREELTYYDNDTSWDFEVDHWVQSIREDRRVEHGTSLDALRVMEIVDSVYRQEASRRGGVPVAAGDRT